MPKKEGYREETERILGLPETPTGLDSYARELGFSDTSKLWVEMDGMMCVDLGSGRGNLAKDCIKRGLNCTIISVNPALANEKSWAEQFNDGTYRPGQISSTKEFAKNLDAQIWHDHRALAALGDRIPITDESVDIIFDVRGPTHYAREEKDVILQLEESLRVLKPGGILYISAPSATEGKVKSIVNHTNEKGHDLRFPKKNVIRIQKVGSKNAENNRYQMS